MKKIIIISALTILTFQMNAQSINFSYNYDSSDVQDAFTLLGIQNFKYQMPSEFKGYYFDLIIKEYFEGKEISSTSQSNRFKNMKQVLYWEKAKNEYVLKIQSLKQNDSIEKFNARMPGIGLRGLELKLKLPRNNYDWATLTNDTSKVSVNSELPILTFSSLPSNSKRPNIAVFCELANSSQENKYLDWYSKFKIKHCFIIFIKVTNN